MKNGIHSLVCALGLAGLAGVLCGCHSPPARAPQSRQNLPAKTRIKLAILADLKVTGQHPEKKTAAYFLLVDLDELPFFQSYLKDNLPRVELSTGNDQPFKNLGRDADGVVIDKLTNKPGTMYGFSRIEIQGGQAHVEVVESVSLVGISILTYEMKLQQGEWTIVAHSRRAIS